MPTADESYRPDIDGLRAVAVLAVVAFHAFPQWLPGGYVGVDVFFVISGFLISSQLMAAAASGQMSFGGFYARRIRRIFPALILVLTAVAVAGWWLLAPQEWSDLRRHVGASAIFGNNFLLWSEAGYFDRAAELKPLLHLWSLGVEEQFYLIWPLLIWWWWRREVRWLAAIALVVAVSFAINVMVVDAGAAYAAFFLPHTRLWQLGAGALLAVLAREHIPIRVHLAHWLYRSPSTDGEHRVANLMSVAGMLLILLSCIALTRGIANPDWWSHGSVASVGVAVHWIARALGLQDGAAGYPGWAALAPTAGAVLVIAAGSGAAVNRAWLSNRAMVFVGLISYPLYLWHWPILSFLQITEQGDVSRALKAAAIVLSVLLASLTYLFIERPVRRSMTPATLPRVAPLAIPLTVIGIVMAVAISTGWLTPPARTALRLEPPVPLALNESVCRSRFPGLGEYCQQFDPALAITTALLGDSHAAHFLPGLGALLKSKGENLVHLGQTGCPPLIGIERLQLTGDHTCLRVNRAMIDALLADDAIITVWLSFRGALAMSGVEFGGGAASDLFRLAGGTATNGAAIRDALRSTIALLQSRGKHVGVLLQVPELGFRVDQCTGRPFSLAHGPARVPCAVPRAAVMARQSAYRGLITEMQNEFGIAVYDPVPALCDDINCQAVAEGHVLYFDDNHLGMFGSSWALRRFDDRGGS
jgi:peptidoglycan/LPS O-acetylase OafA/YrhL